MDDGGDPTRGAVMRELLVTFITQHLFLGLCVATVDTKLPSPDTDIP